MVAARFVFFIVLSSLAISGCQKDKPNEAPPAPPQKKENPRPTPQPTPKPERGKPTSSGNSATSTSTTTKAKNKTDSSAKASEASDSGKALAPEARDGKGFETDPKLEARLKTDLEKLDEVQCYQLEIYLLKQLKSMTPIKIGFKQIQRNLGPQATVNSLMIMRQLIEKGRLKDLGLRSISLVPREYFLRGVNFRVVRGPHSPIGDAMGLRFRRPTCLNQTVVPVSAVFTSFFVRAA